MMRTGPKPLLQKCQCHDDDDDSEILMYIFVFYCIEMTIGNMSEPSHECCPGAQDLYFICIFVCVFLCISSK